jgi:site-specific recombinase XerD
MTSIKPLLYKHKKLKDGSHPIVLQFIKGRKRKLLSLGQSAKEDEWIEEKGIPSKKHPYQDKLRNFIKGKVAEANRITIDYESKNKPYSLEDVVNKVKGIASSEYLFVYLDQIIDGLAKQGRKGNEIVYRCTKNSIQSFHEGDIVLSDIDNKFLIAYNDYLAGKGLKRNSISVYMRTLRSVLNKAIKEGVMDESVYPFNKYTIKSETTAKRAISKDDINSIRGLELELGSTLDITRDFFMFSFYTRGMSFVDLVYLKKSSIQDGRIVYTRRKTGQKFTIKITEQSQSIIDKYTREDNDYIFPIIKGRENEFRDYKNAARLMNKKLKVLATMAGIDGDLTTYVARHSWATIAKRSGIPTAVISEGLGHETEETTQIYLDSFENKTLDDANDLIIK